jgi:hypothetical protein
MMVSLKRLVNRDAEGTEPIQGHGPCQQDRRMQVCHNIAVAATFRIFRPNGGTCEFIDISLK